MKWNYKQPVEIIFGNSKINEIKEIINKLGYKNGLLVIGKSFVKDGLAEKLLNENSEKIIKVFSNISANPDVCEVDECAEIIRKNNIEFIIALGGGSVLDCAKAASVICTINDSISKYHGTNKKLPLNHIPIIALPTTAGTGSEVTNVSVLSDKLNGKKAPIVSDLFYPKIAIIDPELTYSMPKSVTASSGIDVLSHALEAYWSKNHQPICDILATYAASLVFENLEKAYNNPNDKIAREKMAEASLIAGLAFNLPKTTASHACSFPLTNIYKIPHGEACGLTLDYFAKINAKAEDGRLDKFAIKIGFKDAYNMADEIHLLKERINLRNDLKDLNLTNEKIEELVRTSRHPNLYNNPIEITNDMLRKMYKSMI